MSYVFGTPVCRSKGQSSRSHRPFKHRLKMNRDWKSCCYNDLKIGRHIIREPWCHRVHSGSERRRSHVLFGSGKFGRPLISVELSEPYCPCLPVAPTTHYIHCFTYAESAQ